MKEEIVGFLVVAAIGLAFMVGCFRILDKVAADQMEEELESWDAGDAEWLRQLFEERRREAAQELKRRSV